MTVKGEDYQATCNEHVATDQSVRNAKSITDKTDENVGIVYGDFLEAVLPDGTRVSGEMYVDRGTCCITDNSIRNITDNTDKTVKNVMNINADGLLLDMRITVKRLLMLRLTD